ncbi:extracellular solute-binding protein [Kribbella italica]|uniref:Multiple sugar transport system substrate-binding protein n=1 Tax=Kribbella italica TaxID=1540520 RepID=A0A7W9J4L4_9ACTN|nr:extracellular solute-binding protein [Kribbella italica]MBB5835526.1 multiple sugar transport system substrate-binding protein [Kribbella italica]
MQRGLKAAAALAVALTTVLAGCSSGGDGDQAEGQDPATATGTLRVVVPNFSADNEGQAVFQGIVDIFHKTYPQMKVEPDFVPYDNLNQKISTALSAGSNYDVVSAGIGWVQPLADLGAIQSLTKLGVSTEELEKTVYPAFVPPMKFDNDLYAVPVVANPRLLAYSKSAFTEAGLDPAKPPQSLTELREDAKKLTKRDAKGQITRTGFDFWAPAGNYRQQFVAFMGAKGGQMFAEDGQPSFDSPAGTEALQLIHDMVGVDKSSTYGYQNSAKTALVTSGEAAMGFASPYVDCGKGGEGIGDKCKDLVYFNLKDSKEVMYVGGRVAAVGEGTKYPQAALAFVKAMQDQKSQEAISKLDVGVPISSTAGDSAFVKANPAGSFAWKNLDKAVFEYGGATFLDFRSKFGPSLDEVILGRKSPQDVLKELDGVARK